MLCAVLCAVSRVQCAVFSLHNIVCGVQSTVCRVQSTVCRVVCEEYSVKSAVRRMYSAEFSILHAEYS